MLFPWCSTSLVLLCFVSVCYLLLLDLFVFRFLLSLLFTLVFGCVMTGPVMLTETLPFFFQTRHKKGWSSLCSISPACSTAEQGAAPEGLHWLSGYHSSVWCVETQKTKKVTFQKNNPWITMFNGEHICSHSKNITFFSIVLHGRLLKKSICN